MRIEPLSRQAHRLEEVALFLHGEWQAFEPWADTSLIRQRLTMSLSDARFPYTFLALSPDDRLIGTASVRLRELAGETDKHHWLSEVLIRQDVRGQGVGRALIRCCLRYTFSHARAPLYLYTPDQQALYHRLGWHEVGQRHVNGEEVSLMALDWQPPSQ